ncbi:DUF4307 domain-containing protein [Microbacterium sp. AK031]|uniref:DUF4307 domain-containing protein n=1 Tax=Microbacterium sp. AK031 TaxID=2723076 RepID=UPI002169A2CF|nr:DUF4307 domain-containing protein [Microbacterium sp. AK031]MCS3841964.1 hypothetical protein [Microbacterium sp. AK031]
MTTAPELDERYGRGRRSRTSWIVGGAIALVVIVIASWMTVSQSMNAVDADDLSYELVDEHTVTVRFQVTAPQGKDLACAVEALDEEFGVVGWKIVEIPAGDSHMQQLTATIPTVAEATTGLVNSCWAL